MESFNVAMVGMVGSVLIACIPLAVIIVQNRSARQNKLADALAAEKLRKQDQNRQDELAEQASLAAQRLIDRQDELAKQAKEANITAKLALVATEETAAAAKETNTQLVEVAKITTITHALVNSQYTVAIKGAHESTARELALLYEMAEIRKASGQKPRQSTTKAITAAEARLIELQEIIDDMAEQAKMVASGQAKLVVNGETSAADALKKHGNAPVPVADETAAVIGKRIADATEQLADAAQRTASVAENKTTPKTE